jgi:hypothetical protein
MPRPKKIALTIIAIAVGLAMVHYWFTPGIRAIATWIAYKTEGQKLQKDLENHRPNPQAAQGQSAAKRDLYGFAGDDNSVKP